MSVLAFDIGGTWLKAGLVEAGQVRTSASAPTNEQDGADGVLAQLVALGREAVGAVQPDAVGISVRGIVDSDSGAVVDVNAPLRCLIGKPLAAFLGGEFAAPARAENDARAHALGELRHGAGRGASDLVCVTLGTGVGVGVVAGGRVVRGPRGLWGILGGHLTVDVDGPLCTCGNRGCLEALISAQALVADTKERLRSGEPSVLSLKELDPEAIFGAAAAGDTLGRAAVDRFAAILGGGIVSLVHAYDPEVVIVGGGLSVSAAQFLPQVRRHVDQHAWTFPKGRVRIEVAELGKAGALVGAAELATDESWASTWPV